MSTFVFALLALVAGFVLWGHWEVARHRVVWGGAALGTIVGIVVFAVTGNPGLLALTFAVATFAAAAFEWIRNRW